MTVDRLCRLLTVLAVVTVAVLVTRDFVRYIDHYPYLAADDALANVSYAVGTEGRYGFLTSPVQGFSGLPRHEGFFNYGPWYFFAGGALVWLFGYSLEILRSLHLLGILGIATLACVWFGRQGQVAAGAIVALGLLHSLDSNQWPMVRPDIAVSVFATMFIVAAGYAINEDSNAAWCGAGLAAGCGALSHLIAWTLVLDAVVVCALVCALERSRAAATLTRMASVLLGLGMAAVMFYGSFDFRISDHLSTLFGYGRFLEGTNTAGAGVATILGNHLWQAFWSLPGVAQGALATGTAASLLMLGVAPWRPLIPLRRVLSLLLPPIVVLTLYVASLGFYPNYHMGYAILIQVGTLWCVAGAVAALFEWMRERQTLVAVVSVLLVGVAAAYLTIGLGTGGRLRFVHEWVSIGDYTNRVQAFIPEGETAWGSAVFGIESPGRLQLVEAAEAVSTLQRARKVHSVDDTEVAPSYLVWGYPNNRDNTLQALRPLDRTASNVFNRIDQDLPSMRYRLVGLVAAVPYGVTRIYSRGRRSDSEPTPPPLVHVFDPQRQQWQDRLEGPLFADFGPTEAGTFALDYSARDPVSANHTVTADLPAGRFLLRVRLARSTGSLRPTIVGVTSSSTFSEVIGELGPGVDFAPYASTDDEAYLLHEHRGGAIYVSQFDDGAGAAIDGVDVFRIVAGLHDGQVATPMFRTMPDVAHWLPLTQPGVTASITDGVLAVSGDASWQGYQLKSPPVAVVPGSVVTARLEFTPEQGAVCVGALDQTGERWLVSNADPRRDFSFDAAGTKSFTLVLHNCNTTKEGNAPSRFHLGAVRYAVSGGVYVDRLMAAPLQRASAEILVDTPIRRADLIAQATIAKEDGSRWVIDGMAEAPFAYLLQSTAVRVAQGRQLIVSGELKSGGLTIGVLRNGSWAEQTAVTTIGAFQVAIEVSEGGRYEAVIANNTEAPATRTSVVIERFGWSR